MDAKVQKQVDEATRNYQRKLEATSMLVYELQQYTGYKEVTKRKEALESQLGVTMAMLGFNTIEEAYTELEIVPLPY